MTDYEPDLTILQQLLCMTYFCILLIFTLVSIEKSVRFKPKHIHISFIRIPTALSIYRSLSLSHLYLLMLLSRAIMCMSTSFLQKNTSMYLLIHFLDFIFYHVKVQNIKTWKTAKKRCDLKSHLQKALYISPFFDPSIVSHVSLQERLLHNA